MPAVAAWTRAHAARGTMPLVPGQAVEALWPEDGEWYNAVVRAVTNKGIELDYEDGDFRADATEDEIRVKEPVEEESSMADLLDGILDAPDPEPEPGIEVSNEMAHLDAELDDGLGDLLDGIIDDEEEEPAAAPEEPAAARRSRSWRRPARSRRPSPTRIARTSTSRRMLRRRTSLMPSLRMTRPLQSYRRRCGALGTETEGAVGGRYMCRGALRRRRRVVPRQG